MNVIVIYIIFVCLIVQFIFSDSLETFLLSSTYLTIASNLTRTPFDFTIQFKILRDIGYDEYIGVSLPRFSRNLVINESYSNISYSNLYLSPSTVFEAEFYQGERSLDHSQVHFASSTLIIKTKNNYTLPANSIYSITIYKESGIGAACGFAGSVYLNYSYPIVTPTPSFNLFTFYPHHSPYNDSHFYLRANSYNNDSLEFNYFSGVGNGCLDFDDCSGNGICDFCYEACNCYTGHGSSKDKVSTGDLLNPDCSEFVCPSGKAIGDLAVSENQAHAWRECSNQGLCDRKTGMCSCFPPFTGSACEKLSCPNDCSGHGRCLSMEDISREYYLKDSNSYPFIYGSGSSIDTLAWDYKTMFGCVCDSSWSVGYENGETQLSEYFGPDCSLKRCPSGDDPYSSIDETDCHRKTQYPEEIDVQRGKLGNKCHIDCSNRGICDYSKGLCTCFEGSWGEACENIANAGRHTFDNGINVDSIWLADGNSSIIVEGN